LENKPVSINFWTIPAGTRRCFNVEITLKYGRDVVQPIFNYGRPYGYIANVYTTLIQRCLWLKFYI
jgi:hypothetical protein